MNDKELKRLLEEAYYMGFDASGEGYNGEYPYGDKYQKPTDDKNWVSNRDEAIDQLMNSDKYRGPSWK